MTVSPLLYMASMMASSLLSTNGYHVAHAIFVFLYKLSQMLSSYRGHVNNSMKLSCSLCADII